MCFKRIFYCKKLSIAKLFCLPLLIFFLSASSTVFAQTVNDYFLIPGSKATLCQGEKMNIIVKYIDPKTGEPKDALDIDILDWSINGQQNNPEYGHISLDMTLGRAVYTAPEKVPPKNPVAITIRIKPSGENKAVVLLYCNVTIKKASYKISMDAEQSLPDAGQEIKIHGECFADLKALPDGTFMLEPVDKTRNMHVTVEKAIAVEKDGALETLITPLSYKFPFLFSIGKMDKDHTSGHGTVYINYTSPEEGQVIWKLVSDDKVVTFTTDIDNGTYSVEPGAVQQIGQVGNPAKNAITLSSTTQLNLLNMMAANNGDIAIKNGNQNIANAEKEMEFAKRLEAHMHDPNYFRTKQGKADMQKMIAMQKQMGSNVANISDQTQQLRAQINNKAETKPGYVGSKEFHHDLGKEQLSKIGDEDASGKKAIAEVAPGFATVRIEGTFRPKSAEAFTGSLEGSVGPQKSSLKITVRKL